MKFFIFFISSWVAMVYLRQWRLWVFSMSALFTDNKTSNYIEKKVRNKMANKKNLISITNCHWKFSGDGGRDEFPVSEHVHGAAVDDREDPVAQEWDARQKSILKK